MSPASVATWPNPTRAARERRCGRCGAATLFGLDGDRAAGPAAVDVAPVTYLAAVVALLSGVRVYGLAGRVGVGGHLFDVDPEHLERDPATWAGRYPLHLEHRCTTSTGPTEQAPTDRRTR